MKRFLFIAAVIALNIPLCANIRYINYKAIPDYQAHIKEIQYIFNNEYYMETWTPQWKYKVDKKELTTQVEGIYGNFLKIYKDNGDNINLCLFLGDLAHFLYNLDDKGDDYYSRANEFYDKAEKITPNDYRAYWFQGYHEIQSAQIVQGMNRMIYCSTALPPDKMAPGFWKDYTIGAYSAQMYYSAFQAYGYYRKGAPKDDGENLDNVMNSLKNKIIQPSVDDKIAKNNLWNYEKTKKGSMTFSYQLGMKFYIPDGYQVNYTDYDNGLASVVMKPQPYDGYNNSKVGSTIAMIMKTSSLETLNQFIDRILANKYTTRNALKTDLPYDNIIAYSLTDDSLYKDQGGGRMALIAFERVVPPNPGVKLEEPLDYDTSSGSAQYYAVSRIDSRFKSRIFYIFMLDACKSIYDDAYKDYLDFLQNDLIIE